MRHLLYFMSHLIYSYLVKYIYKLSPSYTLRKSFLKVCSIEGIWKFVFLIFILRNNQFRRIIYLLKVLILYTKSYSL